MQDVPPEQRGTYAGLAHPSVIRQGQPLRDDSFLVLFNAHNDSLAFTLPGLEWGSSWAEVLNTHIADPESSGQVFMPAQTLQLPGRSIVLLCSEQTGDRVPLSS